MHFKKKEIAIKMVHFSIVTKNVRNLKILGEIIEHLRKQLRKIAHFKISVGKKKKKKDALK